MTNESFASDPLCLFSCKTVVSGIMVQSQHTTAYDRNVCVACKKLEIKNLLIRTTSERINQSYRQLSFKYVRKLKYSVSGTYNRRMRSKYKTHADVYERLSTLVTVSIAIITAKVAHVSVRPTYA